MKAWSLVVILLLGCFLACNYPKKIPIKSVPKKNREEMIHYYQYTFHRENKYRLESIDFAAKPGRPGAEVRARIRFDVIDQHVRNTPESAVESLEKLAAYLILPAQNGFEKIWAIYRWITLNIEYDIAAAEGNAVSFVIPEEILQERLAVCFGFSLLFNQLSRFAGSESILIPGWARGLTGHKKIFTDQNRHAWNAVRIENGWYLVDCTWGAGSYADGRFIRNPNDFYFLTEPQKFIYTHFPEIPKCQLLPQSATKEEFTRWPLLRGLFFEYGIELPDTLNGTIEVNGMDSLEFRTPENIFLVADLRKDNKKLAGDWTFEQRVDGIHKIFFKLPASGNYMLGIYGRKKDQHDLEYADLLWINLNGTGSAKKNIAYPHTVESYKIRDAFLISPLEGLLASGQLQRFKIRAPEALRVAVVNNDKWYHLRENAGIWEGEALLAPGELVLSANYVVGTRYEGLVIYQVK